MHAVLLSAQRLRSATGDRFLRGEIQCEIDTAIFLRRENTGASER